MTTPIAARPYLSNIHGVEAALLSEAQVAEYERDGAIVIRGAFDNWIHSLAAGIERNMAEPGEYAAENLQAHETGRFFDDYCNWQRIDEFREFIESSPMAQIAASVMRSDTAQFFHDHVLVKEPGTSKPTPWHQDRPYYFVDAAKTVSFWIPIDPVGRVTLRLIAGSHRWAKPVLPVKWLAGGSFYDQGDYLPVPDPDTHPQDYQVLEWAMEPGDAVLFDFGCVHGARGNESTARRRAFSARWVGDDAVYVDRPGPTSPPFPGHGMLTGDRLRQDWFPVLWPPQTP